MVIIKEIYGDNNTLYLDAIQMIINRALWSGWLVDEKPVSLMLIAPAESGKTEMISKFQHNKGVAYLTDITAFSIARDFIPKINMGEIINHLLIPDFLNPTSKQLSTYRQFIQFMNVLIEEGVIEIRSYAIQLKTKGINCGLITSLTKDIFLDRRKYWRKIGFMSRVLPVSYTYNVRAASSILKSITKGNYHNESEVLIQFPDKKQQIKDSPKLYEQFIPYSTRFGEAEQVWGFRYQKQFQALAKANALAEGRSTVSQKDIDWVCHVAEWINFDFKQLNYSLEGNEGNT